VISAHEHCFTRLLHAIAKWLLQKTKDGYEVDLGWWATSRRLGWYPGKNISSTKISASDTVEDVFQHLLEATRMDSTISWLMTLGERGEKMPLKIDLIIGIIKPASQQNK